MTNHQELEVINNILLLLLFHLEFASSTGVHTLYENVLSLLADEDEALNKRLLPS